MKALNKDAVGMDDGVTERTGFVFFWRGWPSQWFRSAFEVDGVRYNCAEQYMMAEKARVFGDSETLHKILAATKPGEQKALGRQVSGFDAGIWDSVCRGIVFAGNVAKFEQDAGLAKRLLETGERTIVEASPVDLIWGIGLAAEDPQAIEPAAWRGRNWLGVALMQVRAKLRGEGMDAAVAEQLETLERVRRKVAAERSGR